jgi:RNA polymerase subunit RPABC4/transcription elongation factor Spt4
VPNKYYCHNCNAEVKPTDRICPKCGKDLREIGRNIVVSVSETMSISGFTVGAELSKEQVNIIKKVFKAIKGELAKKKIESITFGFPQLISVKIIDKDSESKE